MSLIFPKVPKLYLQVESSTMAQLHSLSPSPSTILTNQEFLATNRTCSSCFIHIDDSFGYIIHGSQPVLTQLGFLKPLLKYKPKEKLENHLANFLKKNIIVPAWQKFCFQV